MNYIELSTILCPILSAIAIFVALIISRRSSKDAQEQIKSIRHLLEVFIAANNLNMKEALERYQQHLAEINIQIEDAKEALEIVSPFARGAKIDQIEEEQEKNKQRVYLKQLLFKRKKLELNISLIQDYINKAAQN